MGPTHLFLLCLACLSVAQITVTPIALNTLVHGTVSQDGWAFYSFNIQANKAFLLHVQHGSKYDVDVFVRKGFEVPNRAGNFDYSESGFNPNITIESRIEPVAQHYTLGVYGFRGSAVPFSLIVSESNGCPNSCSGHGQCLRGRCVCVNGYSGDACQDSIQTINTNVENGPYTVSKGEWKYFSVYLNSAKTVEVKVTKVGSAEKGDVDFYVRKSQPPTLFDYDYADLTRFDHGRTSFTLNISSPTVGTWYIGAFGFELSSFTFSVNTLEICPNQCSNHGRCVGTQCACNAGYFGLSCNEYRYLMALNTEYTGYVSANAWNYFKIQPRTMQSIVVTVDHPADGSDCDVYIQNNANPTLSSFTHRNVSLDPHIVTVVPSPGDTEVHIGVYGYSHCSYKLKVTLQAANGCDCGIYGVCNGGRCLCNGLWAGEKCQYQAPLLSNGVTRFGVVVNGGWSYFTFSFQHTHQFVVVMKETNSVGRLALYAQMGTYPTLDHYNIAHRDTKSNYHRISFRFANAYTGTVVLGVYRTPTPDGLASSFKISSYAVPF